MNKYQLINTLIAGIGISSCLYVIFSITMRTIKNNIKNELKIFEDDLLNKLNKKIHATNR